MKNRIIRLLAFLWLAVLLRLTVFRDGCFSHGLFSGRIEWDAFAYYAKLARVGKWRYFSYLFVGNLVWFMPMGVLVRIRKAFPLGRRCAVVRAGADGERTDNAPPSAMQRCAPLRKDGRQITNATDRCKADKRCLSLQARTVGRHEALLRATLWGFLLSLGIESMQYILGSGVSELDDLILNTAGAVLGYALACLWYKISKKMKSPIDKKTHHIDNKR